MEYKELNDLQDQILDNKIKRGFNLTDLGKEIILLTEELGELCESNIDGKKDDIIDAIGDIMVYAISICAMFGWKSSETVKNINIGDYYIAYIGMIIGRLAKTYKRSNKLPINNIDNIDLFKDHTGNLLWACIKSFEKMGCDYIQELTKIIDNNKTRSHNGYM